MSELPWTRLDINAKLFQNTDEFQVPRGMSALENAYINETGGHSRFPALKTFASLPGGGTVFPYEYRGALMAQTTSGRLFKIDIDGAATDVTNVPIAGGKRAIFAKGDDRLLIAAGGAIIQYDGNKTDFLSKDAPETTHVGIIGGIAVAPEPNSPRFFHNQTAGDLGNWNPIDVFSADRESDDINAILVNEFGELLVAGVDSIEQWERGLNAVFAFRHRVSGSVLSPYTLVAADNAAWAISSEREFIRISGQQSQPFSEDIGRVLEEIGDWTDAWASHIAVDGQNFILVQAPYGTSPYGTTGVTFLFDLRTRKWSNLYEMVDGVPGRWRGWSYAYHKDWNRKFVGGEGGRLYELTTDFSQAVGTERVVGRTAHFASGPVCVEGLRMKVRRGVGDANASPVIRLRVNRDNGGWGRWVTKDLGEAGRTVPAIYFGNFGTGESFQFEWQVTDSVDVEIRSLEAQLVRVG